LMVAQDREIDPSVKIFGIRH